MVNTGKLDDVALRRSVASSESSRSSFRLLVSRYSTKVGRELELYWCVPGRRGSSFGH